MKRTTLPFALSSYFAGIPVQPVGFLPNGRPVFPIAGGADDDPPGEDPKPNEKPDFQPIASQADLDRILGERLARERAKYADYDDLRTKAAEFDKAAEAARTDQEKAVEEARNEGKTEALTAANTRLVSAEARALAAEAKFRNPSLAVKAVDLKGVTVNDDGEVDAAAIKAKLKELSDAEPYLIDDGKKPLPKPDRSQGGGKTKSSRLSELSGDELYDRLHPKTT
jgi:hypothetical protein